jgi:hypothetical protein
MTGYYTGYMIGPSELETKIWKFILQAGVGSRYTMGWDRKVLSVILVNCF